MANYSGLCSLGASASGGQLHRQPTKIGLAVVLFMTMLVGYGGMCSKKHHHSGSSAPVYPWTVKIEHSDFATPTPRAYHQMVWDGNEIIMFGGRDASVYYNDTWFYYPLSNSWHAPAITGGPPTGRAGHAAVWDGKKLIIFGGRNGSGDLNDLWWFTPVSNTWTQMITNGSVGSPPARSYHRLFWNGSSAVMFGGLAGNTPMDDLWIYSATANIWTKIVVPGADAWPDSKGCYEVVWNGTYAFMFGGWGARYYDDMWWFDPEDISWIPGIVPGTGLAPSGRSGHQMVWNGRYAVMFGGYDGQHRNDLWCYDPRVNAWVIKIPAGSAGSPESREGHQMVWDGNRSVMFGGYTGTRYRNDLWWYDPSTVGSEYRQTDPYTPSDLGVYPMLSHQVILSFKDNANNEDSYKVERKIGSTGEYAVISVLAADSDYFSDITVEPNTVYYYRVKAYKGFWESEYSNEASCLTPNDWVGVAGGQEHSVGLKEDGTVWTWGYNFFGQLGSGIGNSADRNIPAQVSGLTDCADVYGGGDYSMSRKTNYSLWVWGRNELGQLGVGDANSHTVPTGLNYAMNWVNAAAGQSHGIAVNLDNTLWAWGANDKGQLGTGDNNIRTSPVQIGVVMDYAGVACGDAYSVVTKTDGTIWSVGYNSFSQLGLGDTLDRNTLTQIGTGIDWYMVACGASHTMAVKSDGTLWAWGLNNKGQLGLGDTLNRLAPTQVGTDTDWKYVACGQYHTVAFKKYYCSKWNTLWAWGDNTYGQLGLGDTTNRTGPVRVGSDVLWAKIACGGYHTLVIRTDGTIWGCGKNFHGQLGTGDYIYRNVPANIGR
ncbi:MAG: kelch repeat-containing protein [Planctomycetota bacterium]